MPTSKVVEGCLPCPKCPSSDAFHRYDDGHGYCFSCQYFEGTKERFDLSDFTYEYLPRRNISKATHQFYGTLTKIDKDGKPVAVGYKYPSFTKIRRLERKEFYIEGEAKPGLFGMDRFTSGSHDAVIITEGEDDALSCYEAFHIPAVSVQSASSGRRDVAAAFEWLQGFGRVYLAFDDDEPGRSCLRQCAGLFDPLKVYVLRFAPKKDATDFLQAGEISELKEIFANARKYLPEQIISTLAEFRQALKKKRDPGIPYPIHSLNQKLYGMRTRESVLITAQTGVGKTEVMRAIEHQILEKTNDPIAVFALEESQDDHLRALAGVALRQPVHLPDTGITPDEQADAVEKLVVEDDRLYLFSVFGNDDPEVLTDTIRFLVAGRGVKWVIFDHLSMGVSGLAVEENERRVLDFLSAKLEKMVKDLNFGLIFACHVNDNGQTRGSRMIEKYCDVRIDLTRDIENDSNEVHFKILKNRPFSRSGYAGKAAFNLVTRQFEQEGEPWLPNAPSLVPSQDLSSMKTEMSGSVS